MQAPNSKFKNDVTTNENTDLASEVGEIGITENSATGSGDRHIFSYISFSNLCLDILQKCN